MVILNTKDIRFTDAKINVLLRGGIVSRDDLRNSKNSIIEMSDVPFGVAKRINSITAIDVKEHKDLNNWYHIACGDTEELVAVYCKNINANEIKVSFSCEPKISEEAKESIDEMADVLVEKIGEMNSDKRTILEDGVTVSEEIEIKRTHEPEESEEVDEVEDDSSDEEEEDIVVDESTSDTPSRPQQNNVYRRQGNGKKRRH